MAEDTSIVRLMTWADTDSVLEMCRLAAEETQAFPMSEPRVREKLQQAADRKLAICGVIGDVGAAKASIFLEIGTLWYTDHFGLHELWNIVHPKHRKSAYGRVLLHFAKEAAEKLKLPLEIGVFSIPGSPRPNVKIDMYARKFGPPVGAFFLYNAAGLR